MLNILMRLKVRLEIYSLKVGSLLGITVETNLVLVD